MRSLSNSVILLIAFLLAVVVGVLVLRFIQQQKAKGVVPGRVVVASQNIKAQDLISAEMVDVQTMPIADVPPNSLGKLDSVVGQIAKVDITRGSVISGKDIVSEGENLIDFLPVNFRAMTISIRQNPGEANLYRLGQKVDVLVTLREAARLRTKTILQNVRILYKNPPKLESDRGAGDVNYTFAVTPEDAEKLALAQREGNIQIVMRSQGDGGTVQTTGTSSDQILGRVQSAIEGLRGTSGEVIYSDTEDAEGPAVEIIRGIEIEIKQFGTPAPDMYMGADVNGESSDSWDEGNYELEGSPDAL